MAYFPGSDEVIASLRAATLVHFSLQYDDASGTYTVPVPAGTFVHEIGTFVSEAFTTSGANAALTIGDGGAATGFMASTDTVLQTIDTVTTLASGAGETYATGKYYPTADTIDFAFTPAASGATAGKVVGFVIMSNVKLDGIPSAAAAA
jgi:hypothetical protein